METNNNAEHFEDEMTNKIIEACNIYHEYDKCKWLSMNNKLSTDEEKAQFTNSRKRADEILKTLVNYAIHIDAFELYLHVHGFKDSYTQTRVISSQKVEYDTKIETEYKIGRFLIFSVGKDHQLKEITLETTINYYQTALDKYTSINLTNVIENASNYLIKPEFIEIVRGIARGVNICEEEKLNEQKESLIRSLIQARTIAKGLEAKAKAMGITDEQISNVLHNGKI